MKQAAVFSFSKRGHELAEQIRAKMSGDWDVELSAPRGKLQDCVAEAFKSKDALIFVGACGIAVRAIAPFVASKTADPAVLVMDDCGKHVISLLSGHIGGANALTRMLAAALKADPVITTATDVNGRFSVDTWASEHGVAIGSMVLAKRFSAEILENDLLIHSETEIVGNLPAGIKLSESGKFGAMIGVHTAKPFQSTLNLIPRILVLGIGCKRDTSVEKITVAVRDVLDREGIYAEAVCAIASIDVKKDEPGLISFAENMGIAPVFYSAEELNQVEGDFPSSDFVRRTVGVDNVCERSAMLAAGEGAEILVHKTCADGVTVAIARKKWSVSFE